MVKTTSNGTALASRPDSRCAGRPARSVLAMAALLLFLSFSMAVLTGCAPGTQREDRELASQNPLIWPDPPEPARIRYVKTIEGPEDIGARKGILKRMAEFVFGTESNDIIKPYGIAVDSAGRILVADTAFKRVHVYDVKGSRYTYIDHAGKKDLISPISVAVDKADYIYVTDSMTALVHVYDPKGRHAREIRGFERPTGIAIDQEGGLIYVVDTGAHNVKVLGLDGSLKRKLGDWGDASGKFNIPVDVFVDNAGYIYVVDTMNYKVQVFDRDGNLVSRFGRQGDGTGDFGRPKGVAVDRDGHIYVADALFDTVQIFDREGRFLLNFGRIGRDRGSFWMPTGLFIDRGNNIYVADSFNRRVQVFEYMGDPGVN